MSGIAVVGAGTWGRNLVRNYGELGVLRAVCDADESALARVRALFPAVRAVRDLESVLQDPEVRGIAIALPPALHFEFASRSLAAGKDVCVEKPLALNVAHARALERLAERQGRILMTGHLLRYHPAFREMLSMVRGGAFGALRWIGARRRDFRDFGAGSSLWDLAPHDVSLILSLTGESPARVEISGSGRFDGGPADLRLLFPSGVKAHVQVSRTHPRKERIFEVITERARIVFDDGQLWARKLAVYEAPGAPDGAPRYASLTGEEPLRAECRHFVECILERRRPLTDGAEASRVLEVLDRTDREPDAVPWIRVPSTAGIPSGAR